MTGRITLAGDALNDIETLADHTCNRVDRRQAGVGSGDDEELAPRSPGGLDLGLCHPDDATRIRRSSWRRLVNRVARAARSSSARIATLNDRGRERDAPRRVVVHAVFSQIRKRSRGLGVVLRIQRDLERAATRLDDGREPICAWPSRRWIE